jgi:hypothetical protein
MKESSTDLIESAAQGSNVEMKENVQSCSSPKSTFDFGSFGGIPESQSYSSAIAKDESTAIFTQSVLSPTCMLSQPREKSSEFFCSQRSNVCILIQRSLLSFN